MAMILFGAIGFLFGLMWLNQPNYGAVVGVLIGYFQQSGVDRATKSIGSAFQSFRRKGKPQKGVYGEDKNAADDEDEDQDLDDSKKDLTEKLSVNEKQANAVDVITYAFRSHDTRYDTDIRIYSDQIQKDCDMEPEERLSFGLPSDKKDDQGV